jgi:hypothetical protein
METPLSIPSALSWITGVFAQKVIEDENKMVKNTKKFEIVLFTLHIIAPIKKTALTSPLIFF